MAPSSPCARPSEVDVSRRPWLFSGLHSLVTVRTSDDADVVDAVTYGAGLFPRAVLWLTLRRTVRLYDPNAVVRGGIPFGLLI